MTATTPSTIAVVEVPIDDNQLEVRTGDGLKAIRRRKRDGFILL